MTVHTHSLKRRRISAISPSEPYALSQPPFIPTTAPKIITTSTANKSLPNPTCVSCHRSLNSTQGYLILCSRCSNPTCVVCSRTCSASSSSPPTATLHPPISPPSTSCSPSPPTWPSPRRVALGFTSNTNTTTPPSPTHPPFMANRGTLGKRRKFIEEDESANASVIVGVEGQEILVLQQCLAGANNSNIAGFAEIDHEFGYDSVDQPGCGSIVCRKCCSEDSHRNTISCYDCSPP
ncbi:hypothetical protein D9756_009192 [Leucocoprinus leucothites]|uniref:Uncharacterized protein n=1 Tax=Leucocoprinus leucothites TaxID=201217 RepID=A0A8H5FVA5_9AGAR|nr:hypothetical protein D9756_009192 [Leucoagaricus leucothites]